MKHLSGYDNVLETEAWCFWGNMKVLLGHLDRARDTESPRSDPADKIFLGLCIVSNVSKWAKILLKMRQKLLLLAPALLRV